MNVTSSHSNTVTPYVPTARMASTNASAQHPSILFAPIEQAAALSGAQAVPKRTELIYGPSAKRDSVSATAPSDERQVKGEGEGAGDAEINRSIAAADSTDADAHSGQDSGSSYKDGEAADRRPDAGAVRDGAGTRANTRGMSAAELDVLAQMAQRDQEVRAHEQAHAAVGGRYAGAPAYKFEQGPDGVAYAVSGEVPIDVAPVAGDAEATMRKMQQVQNAALAPAEPSAQDLAVAGIAARQLQQAQAESLQQAFDFGELSDLNARSSESPTDDTAAAAAERQEQQQDQPDRLPAYKQAVGISTYRLLADVGIETPDEARPSRHLDVLA